ncbi:MULTISPECIES: RNA polymerase sigma factor [unclassified Imperialibacter]|uniref:RNA polymerase sigma factor n=1 Tax=unclassified Imperialibacter TaxID=2629706 RepID=UPI001254AF7D|nr:MULTISPECIES: RNA polymerase sigma factor [unclassified Imperialibacter]CAD5250652.1 Sigma-70 family RNA polymerase sigma factor [Imperialibacter sp. 75]CAD5286173.1 Sigma-70 family RNA polymerase sigma factor [Imperialibacter sp. 89]VVT05334.1 RNA polymerase subunit sigma-70 [Imperialibacter sp. EC-SDR9]
MKVSDEFLELTKQHHGIVTKICRVYCDDPDDRQDLFQEIMLQLWKSFGSFQHRSKFSTWLYRVALNTAIGHLSKRKKRVPTDDIEGKENHWSHQPEETKVDEDITRMYQAIARLSEVEKALVTMYLEEHSYEEMEEVLGINDNNLRVKMHRIKDRLKKIMGEMP